jgi:MarR family 2-MHQ and catechol resistance regulon transcriptional repressor
MSEPPPHAPPPVPWDEDTAAALKLWVVLHRAQRAVAELDRRDMERHGLHPTEFAVLEVLLHKGPLPLGELGSRILLTSGSTTHVVDKLEGRGLLRRRPCPEDRRVTYAELTGAGRARIAGLFPAHAEALRQAMGGLTLEEKRLATGLLKRLGLFASAATAPPPASPLGAGPPGLDAAAAPDTPQPPRRGRTP